VLAQRLGELVQLAVLDDRPAGVEAVGDGLSRDLVVGGFEANIDRRTGGTSRAENWVGSG
jgi:hypothetical protein